MTRLPLTGALVCALLASAALAACNEDDDPRVEDGFYLAEAGAPVPLAAAKSVGERTQLQFAAVQAPCASLGMLSDYHLVEEVTVISRDQEQYSRGGAFTLQLDGRTCRLQAHFARASQSDQIEVYLNGGERETAQVARHALRRVSAQEFEARFRDLYGATAGASTPQRERFCTELFNKPCAAALAR